MSNDHPHSCPRLERALSDSDALLYDPDYPLIYVDQFREYGIRIFDGGSSFLVIDFCPFCGASLPPRLRKEWFERLERLGLEIEDPRLPDEMRDGSWWRGSAR
jgi:hypothetical protein